MRVDTIAGSQPSPMPWNPLQSLTADQRDRLAAFQREFLALAERLNLVSQNTRGNFAHVHILHSMALSWKRFPPGSKVVDFGSGGGLPAIPLAIAFPEVDFYAVDAVQKKIHAVRAVGRRLGLTNLHAWHGRAEAWPGTAHYSVSRAAAPLHTLWRWHAAACLNDGPPPDAASWEPGVLCLKGGDLRTEKTELARAYPSVHMRTTALDALMGRDTFPGKVLVELLNATLER